MNEQDAAIAILEKKGFREINRLSFGDVVMIKRSGGHSGVREQVQVDENGDVNGMDVETYLKGITGTEIRSKDEVLEWAKNLASQGVEKSDLMSAAKELGLDLQQVDRRYQHAGYSDLVSEKGIYFILTGKPHPRSGYTWASELSGRTNMKLEAANKYQRTDIVIVKQNGKDVETEVLDVKRKDGVYVYTLDKVDNPILESELKRAASNDALVASDLLKVAKSLVGGGWGQYSEDLSDILEGLVHIYRAKGEHGIFQAIKNKLLTDRPLAEMMKEEEMNDADLRDLIRENLEMYKMLGRTAMDFPTQDAYDKYMKDHPDADKSNHSVVENKKEPAKKEISQLPSHTSPHKTKSIGGVSPEEYAALWGSTKGQGAAHFYNYSSEKQEKDNKFYEEFINGRGGIRDTMKTVSDSLNKGEKSFDKGDLENLNKLLQHVEAERKSQKSKKSSNDVLVAGEMLKVAKELVAMDFPDQKAMDKYLKEHPDADRSNHKVVQHDPSNLETHPFNLMRQRKNEEKMNEIGKALKKKPEDLTVDDITKYNDGKKATESTVEKNASSSKTSKEETSMSRERMTNRTASAEVLGALTALKKALTAADDAELTQWADELAKQEKKVVGESTPDAELKDVGDQNAKANANWPLTEKERMTVASTLVTLAKELVQKK